MLGLAGKGLASLINKLAIRAIKKYDVPAPRGKTAAYRGEFLPYKKEFSKTGIGSKKPGQWHSNDPLDSEMVMDTYADMIKGVPVFRRSVIPNKEFIRGAGRGAKQNYMRGEAMDPGASLFSEMKEAMKFAKEGLPGVPFLRSAGSDPGKVISGIAPLFTKKQLPFLLERIKDPEMRKIILKLLFGRTSGLKKGGSV
tara:strand:- start:126 stop:716 length:591 start_codon:yes stop_codon:yes gene_type:complete